MFSARERTVSTDGGEWPRARDLVIVARDGEHRRARISWSFAARAMAGRRRARIMVVAARATIGHGCSPETDGVVNASGGLRHGRVIGLGEAFQPTMINYDKRSVLEIVCDEPPPAVPSSTLLEASDRQDRLLAITPAHT